MRPEGDRTTVFTLSIGRTQPECSCVKEERIETEYSTQLVENSSLKAFELGLREKNLVTNLCPFLRTSRITDNELMKNVNELATQQQERKITIGVTRKHSKTAKAQAVSMENKAKAIKLTAELQQLKMQVAESVHHIKTSPRGKLPPRCASRSRGQWQGGHSGPPHCRCLAGCQKCQSNGTPEQCSHCFQCGDIFVYVVLSLFRETWLGYSRGAQSNQQSD